MQTGTIGTTTTEWITAEEVNLAKLVHELQWGQIVITKEGGKIVNVKKTESVKL